MDGLEVILFAVFVVFVLINLLIRFIVRKSRRRREEGIEETTELSYSEEIGSGAEEPWVASKSREAFGEETTGQSYATQQEVAAAREAIVVQRRIEEVEAAAQELDVPSIVEEKGARKEEIGAEMEDRSKEWEKRRIEKLEGTIEVLQKQEAGESSFWERIERLPSLQRAIVLSEVLGPPKGIGKVD